MQSQSAIHDLVGYSPAVSALIAAIAACISVWTLFSNRRSKVADTIAWCMTTFYDIQSYGSKAANADDAKRYFERLWGLQLVEYHFYKFRMIPENLYVLWLGGRHQEYWSNTLKVADTSFKQGWDLAKPHIQDPDFINFVDDILRNAGEQREHIRKRVRKLVSRKAF
jgi:hypothetical protein